MKTSSVRFLMLALVCFGLRHTSLARPMTTVRVRQERQKEIERQIRENERRQNELRQLRQKEEAAAKADWLQYLDQLRASNLEIRVAIEQERRRRANSCCATLEDGRKCENTACEGEWFCLAHKDPPRDAIDKPVLTEDEVEHEPQVAHGRKSRLRNEGKEPIGRKRSKRRPAGDMAGEADGECDGKSVVWIVVAVGSVLCVVFLTVFRKLSSPGKGYATKRTNRAWERV